MSVRLDDTTASAVSAAIDLERFRQGSSAVNRVLTLVIVADESTQADAVDAAADAAREHPCRILTAIPRPGRGPARLDATVQVGGGDGLGELVELRLRGPLAAHVRSVVLPLLVPDSPVVVWWPSQAPAVPAEDPVGALAQRRITDSAASGRPLQALESRRLGYRPGDTDLAWTRITAWRALLAANLDQPHDPITGATVTAQKGSPSALLLAAWLHERLDVDVEIKASRGPGITGAAIHTSHGDIAISRPSGGVALLSRPGFPDREAALARRSTEGLIAEELRRLDADEVYGETLASLPRLLGAAAASAAPEDTMDTVGAKTTKGRARSTAAAPAAPAKPARAKKAAAAPKAGRSTASKASKARS